MRTKEPIITPPDPLSGRRRSRVDAYMPWSSLGGMAPVDVVAPTAPNDSANAREPAILPGGCRLYSFPTMGR